MSVSAPPPVRRTQQPTVQFDCTSKPVSETESVCVPVKLADAAPSILSTVSLPSAAFGVRSRAVFPWRFTRVPLASSSIQAACMLFAQFGAGTAFGKVVVVVVGVEGLTSAVQSVGSVQLPQMATFRPVVAKEVPLHVQSSPRMPQEQMRQICAAERAPP